MIRQKIRNILYILENFFIISLSEKSLTSAFRNSSWLSKVSNLKDY